MSKKELVIETARDLFTKYGYKKVSMDEIAKGANVTKKTIYSYFKDKETLFRYFIDEELNTMKENIEKIYKNNSSTLDKVSKSIYYMLTFRKNSKLFQVTIDDIDKDLSKKFNKVYDDIIINHIEERINLEIKNKTIKKCNSHLMAFIIYKIYLSLMFEYDDELDEKIVTEEVTKILRDGLLN